VEEYFPLKRAGSNYKACCPFHHEKTPSFVVSPEKQIFHCFGCGESGNTFNFIMKMENLGFMEVLKRLSERTGIKLDLKDEKKFRNARKMKDEIIELNNRSSVFYNKILKSSQGSKAREYLKKRGLTDDTIEEFRLGYAPAGHVLHKNALKKEGVSEYILLKSGLCGKDNSGRLFDMFRDRIIFPIFDERGHIMGFGGRVMASSQQPKYLNTAQTEVFEKKKLLYGFYQGKDNIKSAAKILLLEGYMDVITAHQNGFKNAVATLGTALSEEHIYKIKHWVDEIIFTFDGDEAGSKATERGFEKILGSDLVGKVCELPEGNDPEDVIRRDKEGFINKIETAVPVLDWRIDYSIAKYEYIDDPVSLQEKIVQDIAPIFAVTEDRPIQKARLIEILSHKLDNKLKKHSNSTYLPLEKEFSRVLKKMRKFEKKTDDTVKKYKNENMDKMERLRKEILHVIIKYPEYITQVKDFLENGNAKGDYYRLLSAYINEYSGDIHRLIESEEDTDIRNAVSSMAMMPLNSNLSSRDYLNKIINDYKKLRMSKKFEFIALEINDLIKNNKAVPKEKKEEYDKLKKALKSSRRNINKIGGYFA
jgi:DNA primase